MSSQAAGSRSRGAYFSLDALLASSIAIFAFCSAASILWACAGQAQQSSQENANALLALRLSDAVLEQAASPSSSSHYEANEIGSGGLRGLDLAGLAEKSKSRRLWVSVSRGGETLFSAFFGEKTGDGEAFCSRRLARFEGRVSSLEVCFS